MDSANYYLPRDSSADGSGSRSLRDLETYLLTIESEGITVKGSTQIPAKPMPRIIENGNSRVIVWRKASAAYAYFVESETEDAPGLITTDTTYSLRYSRDPSTIPIDPQFKVIALDKNAAEFFLHTELARSGLDTGYGLFGSATVSRLAIPRIP